MDLRPAVIDVLGTGSRALTFDEIVRGVAERIEGEIKATLKELVDEGRVTPHIGGRDYPWRYQGQSIKRM